METILTKLAEGGLLSLMLVLVVYALISVYKELGNARLEVKAEREGRLEDIKGYAKQLQDMTLEGLRLETEIRDLLKEK